MFSLINTTCWVAVLEPSLNVKQPRGSESAIFCYKSGKILGLWLQKLADWWGKILGSLGRVYIALGEKRSVCVKLVTSSLNLYLVPGDWIKIAALFFSECRPSPGRITLILFFFDCLFLVLLLFLLWLLGISLSNIRDFSWSWRVLID